MTLEGALGLHVLEPPSWRFDREMLSAALGMAHPMLSYKAEEAGTRLHLSTTRRLKPPQRRSACWERGPKTLAARPQPRVGGAPRREQAWDGRGGETQTSATATGQVQTSETHTTTPCV